MIWRVIGYIIKSYHEEDLEITNLRLQKILYVIQLDVAQHLKKIAFEEEMRAWKFGPVFPEVYNLYSSFGRDNISNVLCNSDVDIPQDIMEIVEHQINRTKKIHNPWNLVRESHKKGGVWDLITKGGNEINSQVIPNELLLK